MRKKINKLDSILSGMKKDSGIDLKKFTIILKNHQTKQNFVDEMESRSTSAPKGFIPSRSCISLIETNNSRRVLSYNLTKEEAKLIEKDPRVECVEEYIEKTIEPFLFTDKSKWLKPFDYVENVENQDSKDRIKIQSLDQYATISGLPDGSDVDVVVVDGFIPPNSPEFANNPDGAGGSRLNQINWYDVINYTNPSYPSYPYLSYITGDPDVDGHNNHGCHVSGIVAGNTQGWAKKSNIYNIFPYTSYMQDGDKDLFLYALKIWHENKPINDLYGNKNPTIINNSWGNVWPMATDVRDISRINYKGSSLTPPRNYSGAGLSAVLNSSGGLQEINVINQGNDYTNEPDISFYGGGQAEAIAEIANNSVKKIVITDGGSDYDYNNPPTVSFSEPPPGGVRATGTIISAKFLDSLNNPLVYIGHQNIGGYSGSGGIFFIELTEAGSGYIEPPTVTFSSPAPGGRVAQAYVEIGSNFIKKINITNGGTGYFDNYSIPYVILSGGNPSESADISISEISYNGAAHFVDINGSILNGVYEPAVVVSQDTLGGPVSIYSNGGDYSSQPIVSFLGGNYFEDGSIVGTKPIARAIMGTGSDAGKIVSVNIIKEGEGYTSPPNIVITNGGGFSPAQLRSYGLVVYSVLQYGYLPETYKFIIADMPLRDAAIDADMKDLIDSGAVVIAAAGNHSYGIDIPSSEDYDNSVVLIGYAKVKAESSIISADEKLFLHYYRRGSSPGSCPGVICVGSVESASTEYKNIWSNTGPRVDVYASGDLINSSTYNLGLADPRDNNYCLIKLSGTSMASPQVCGMIACYAQNNRTINQEDAYNFIVNNAVSSIQQGDVSWSDYRSLQGGANRYAYFPGVTYE